MAKKICITGHSRNTMHSIPFSNRGWDIWGLNAKPELYTRFDRWFDVHSADRYWALDGWDNYLKFLQANQEILWLSKADSLLPKANVLPIKDIKQVLGVYKFTGSFMIMMGAAMLEDVSEILVAGVDLKHRNESEFELPGVMYSIRKAMDAGIKVKLPLNCHLLQSFTGIERTKINQELVELVKVPKLPVVNPHYDYGLEKSPPKPVW